MLTLYSGLNGLFSKKKAKPNIKTVQRPISAKPAALRPFQSSRPVNVPVVKMVQKPIFVQPVVTKPFARPVIATSVKTVTKPIFNKPVVTEPIERPKTKSIHIRPVVATNSKAIDSVSNLKPSVKIAPRTNFAQPVVTRPVYAQPVVKRPVIAPSVKTVTKPIFNKPVVTEPIARPKTKSIHNRPVVATNSKAIDSVSNLKPATIAKAEVLQALGIMPNAAQLQTMAAAKGTSVEKEVEKIVENAPAISETEFLSTELKNEKSNTMLYLGGGIIVAGLVYVALKK